jgi:ankyrin repeat protein
MRSLREFVATLALAGAVGLGALAAGVEQPSATVPAKGAAPDARADAMWEAARKGDPATVRKLLDEGVDVNAKFRYGATALSYACDRGHLEVVRVLLERGADPNVKDTFYGATPLSWASSPAQARKPEHAEIVRLLLKYGARGQDAALLSAVREGDEPMTRVILEHGGLSAATLTDALEAAGREKQPGLVALLEKAGAKPAPVVTLSEAQLTRCAGSYSNGATTLIFAVKDGKLQGGPPGQSFVLVPRSETTFAIEGAPGVLMACAADGTTAASITVTQGGTPTVYARVEGK